MGWMGTWWIIGIPLAVVVIWALVRAPRGPGERIGPSESSQEILQRRYAKGEIDRETYHRMLNDLKG